MKENESPKGGNSPRSMASEEEPQREKEPETATTSSPSCVGRVMRNRSPRGARMENVHESVVRYAPFPTSGHRSQMRAYHGPMSVAKSTAGICIGNIGWFPLIERVRYRLRFNVIGFADLLKTLGLSSTWVLWGSARRECFELFLGRGGRAPHSHPPTRARLGPRWSSRKLRRACDRWDRRWSQDYRSQIYHDRTEKEMLLRRPGLWALAAAYLSRRNLSFRQRWMGRRN